jgi:nucleoside-diphosphate-sugar epimerase
VEEIRTVARRPLPEGTPARRGRAATRVTHVRADLRSPEARRALGGVDLLYHLGFQLWLGPGGPDRMEQVNLAGTANVVAAGPARIVLASSAAVYGAWADNPCPLPESHPARPNPECAYAGHKLAAERMCADEAPTVSLRLAAVLGPHADPAVRAAVAGYRLAVPVMAGVRTALQFVDEDDAADALVAAGRARRDLPAVLNVAPPDWADGAGVAAAAGGRVVRVPRGLLMGASRIGRRVGILPFGVDRSVLLSGPLALDPSAAASHLGWRAQRSSAATLAQMLGPRPTPEPGAQARSRWYTR